MSERRGFTRVRVDVTARFQEGGKGDGRGAPVRVEDFTLDGARVIAAASVDARPGMAASLAFPGGEAGPLAVRATVLRAESCPGAVALGLRFEGASPDERRDLANALLRWHQSALGRG